jgi:hypothetical protein
MLRHIVTPFRSYVKNSSHYSSSAHKTLAKSANTESIFSKIPTHVKGVYDPKFEKDSCGVGVVAQLKRQASRQIVIDANQMLVRMSHRGGCGCEVNTGDGAGTARSSEQK